MNPNNLEAWQGISLFLFGLLILSVTISLYWKKSKYELRKFMRAYIES